MGSKDYSPALDIWSIGCIFAEFFIKKPLFEGTNEEDQLMTIFKIRGKPTKEEWPQLEEFPIYKKYSEGWPDEPGESLNDIVPGLVNDKDKDEGL